MSISDTCKHDSSFTGYRGWCHACVMEQLAKKSDEIRSRDIEIAKLEKAVQQLVSHDPKHGYGAPPQVKGFYFYRFTGSQAWFYARHDPKVMGWNDRIIEYYGPIPFEIWEKIEEKKETLAELLEATLQEVPESQSTFSRNARKFFQALAESVDQLMKTANHDPANPFSKSQS